MLTFPKPLDAKEEDRLIAEFRQGKEEARGLLIEHNLRLVAHIVKKYLQPDKDNEDLLSEYKKLQYNLQYATMNNKKIDKKALKKMESIQNKIRDNEKIYNYLLSEEKFNLMMDNINKIIAQTVKEDYK